MQPRDPAPRQRVRRRIPIGKPPQRQRRAQLPRQAEREDPDRGKLHPRPVVQIAGRGQLGRPGVETVDPGLPIPRGGEAARLVRVGRHARLGPRDGLQIGGPQRRAAFEPALPVAAPEHLADEFLGRARAVAGQHGRDYLVLADQPTADRGGETRDMDMPPRPLFQIAQAGIVGPRKVGKGRQPVKRRGAGEKRLCLHRFVSRLCPKARPPRPAGKPPGPAAQSLAAGLVPTGARHTL